MKRALTTVLIFAVIMAALLGINALVERLRPEEEPADVSAAEESEESEEPKEQITISNALDLSDATFIRLSDGGTAINGLGAVTKDGSTVEIGYPGTYWIEGSMEDGQIIVDLGSFDGAAYLVLNGISLACKDGPAIHVKQADLTAVYLMEGTTNTLSDGSDYMVQEAQERKTGAGIYCADSLLIYGDGALTVYGNTADGIRSKDALIIASGDIAVYAADDGLQASDLVDIYGGTITISSEGDGVATTEGDITIFDGTLDIISAQDGIQATGSVNIQAGTVSVVSHGGADNYEAAALADISAKGIKGESVSITGGTILLDTADDGIHAARDAEITGGSFTLSSGDDAVTAAGVLNIRGVHIEIPASYEALEGDTILLSDMSLSASAENNGMDAGEGGLTANGSRLDIEAPRAVSSDGALNLTAVSISHAADGTDSLFSFEEAKLIGCSVLSASGTGRSDVLLSKGALPGSMLFGFPQAVPAGTRFSITDPSGSEVYAFTLDRDAAVVLLVMDGLLDGQSYTLTAGENTMEFTYTSEGNVVIEQSFSASSERSGRGSREPGR